MDASGTPVRLRGVNVPGFPGTDLYAKAVDIGANLVRMPVHWSEIEPTAPVDGQHAWSETTLGKIDMAVQYYRENGVNVMIDFHQFGWSPYWSGGKGIPAWYYADGRFSSRKEAQAAWWTDAAGQRAFEAFAMMMIERYRAYPNVVGYEIFNEPQPGTLGQNHAATQTILTWQAQVLDHLRPSDGERTFFLSPRQGGCLGLVNADFSVFSSLRNVALDCHLYFSGRDGTGFSSDEETWYPTHAETHNQSSTSNAGTEANQEAVLLVLLNRARSVGIPLLIGEWGARRDDTGVLTYQDQVLRVYDRYGVSWARWALSTIDQQGVLTTGRTYTPAGKQLQEHLLGIGPTNMELPSISGFPQQGAQLRAQPGEWTGTGPKRYAYEWHRCASRCSPIPGADGPAYVVTSEDVGTRLQVVVTASTAGGAAAATSAPTATVIVAEPPVNTGAPVVSGPAEEAATLSGTNGTWTSDETPSYRYEWERCDGTGGACAPIPDATASSYTLGAADVDHTLRLAVYAATSQGEGVARALPTPVVAPLPPAVTKPAAAVQTATSFTVEWASRSTASVAGFDVFVRSAGPSGSFGPPSTWKNDTNAKSATFSAAPGTTYCFAARASTAGGTTSRWGAERCTVVPLDDRSLATTGNWRRLTGSAYFQGTYSRSSTLGDRLTVRGVTAKHLAVVATKCPGCGTLRVLWNGVQVRQVSLASTTTQRKQLVAQIAFSGTETGDVVLVVASSGAPVEIDGLAVGSA